MVCTQDLKNLSKQARAGNKGARKYPGKAVASRVCTGVGELKILRGCRSEYWWSHRISHCHKGYGTSCLPERVVPVKVPHDKKILKEEWKQRWRMWCFKRKGEEVLQTKDAIWQRWWHYHQRATGRERIIPEWVPVLKKEIWDKIILLNTDQINRKKRK